MQKKIRFPNNFNWKVLENEWETKYSLVGKSKEKKVSSD